MLRRLWDGWLELAHYIGEFQARLILTTVYFTLLAPFSLLAGGGDPLSLKTRGNTGWLPRRAADADLASSARQF